MTDRPPRLLFIEDDAGKRYTIARQLRLAGMVVEEAENGTDGLARLTPDHDVVILDLRLPDLHGIEICQRIKRDPATAAVMVIELSAALTSASDRARGLELGADAYLVHPVEGFEIVATVRALMRLRTAERRLDASVRLHRTVTETASVGLAIVAVDGRCTFLNRAGEDVLGLDAEAAGRVRLVELFTRAGDADADADAGWGIDRALQGGAPVRHLRVTRGDRLLELTANPIAPGAAAGAVIELKDVTVIARSEHQRDLFLAILGHDLRNPLGTISMGADLLRTAPGLSDRERNVIARVDRTVVRMRKLIDHLLIFAQTLVDRLPLTRSRVDLAEVARAAAYEHASEARPIEVVDELGEPIEADADRIAQVLDNLLGNAIRHGQGPVTIRLTRDGDAAVLAVHNHGEPIPEALMTTIFDPFRRGARREGVGLGLYIVDQIARAHGGAVTVSSLPTTGTTFSVQLPRV